MSTVTISFPEGSKWYKKFHSRTYKAELLLDELGKFAFVTTNEKAKTDELLLWLSEHLKKEEFLFNISYSTDERSVQFKKLFRCDNVCEENDYTTFIFGDTKN